MNLGAPKGPEDKRNSQKLTDGFRDFPTPGMGGNIALSIFTFLSIEELPGFAKC